jgi:Ca2+-binding EF-hand superfamily protein
MNQTDFKKFVKNYIDKAEEHEMDSLFRHFDQSRKGFITKEEFSHAFGRDVQEQVFKIGIEDIIKPLATKINKHNVNAAQLFEKYDLNKNGTLSADELARAFKNDMNIVLNDDEVLTIKEYFKNKYNSFEVKKMDFVTLISKKFVRQFDKEKAKHSL